MPVSRLRKNRKKPFYVQTIIEPEFVWKQKGYEVLKVKVRNERYPGICHIKHRD